MAGHRLDPEQSKAAIIEAARTLFAYHGFSAVTVRDIAKAAGVTHGLVHYHFGSKDDLIAEVVQRETRAGAENMVRAVARDDWETVGLPRMLRYYMTEGRTSILLVMRAEFDGLRPEAMLVKGETQSLGLLASSIERMWAARGGSEAGDPALVAAYIGAAVFSFATMYPWLLNAVGLSEEDYEARLDELVELSRRLITASAGVRQEV